MYEKGETESDIKVTRMTMAEAAGILMEPLRVL